MVVANAAYKEERTSNEVRRILQGVLAEKLAFKMVVAWLFHPKSRDHTMRSKLRAQVWKSLGQDKNC